MLNEHVTLPPLSRDIFNDQHGYNMTQLQGYNTKLSQPGMLWGRKYSHEKWKPVQCFCSITCCISRLHFNYVF